MKSLLIKNKLKTYITFEELQAVVIEVEAILNSLPLTPLLNDPNEGAALTTAHLLFGTSDKYIDVDTAFSFTQWRVRYLRQGFREMWSRDYILNLPQRSKQLKPEANN